MPMLPNEQILKTRDDRVPVSLSREIDGDEERPKFKLKLEASCSWAGAAAVIDESKLRSRIEPWLTALFQSEHFSLLVGSGLTHAVHRMATGQALSGMATTTLNTYDAEIVKEATRSATAAGRSQPNVEDQIRVANDLLRGLQVIASTKTPGSVECRQVAELESALGELLGEFADSILKGEAGLIKASAKGREEAFNYLVSFLMSFASRSGTRDRLQLFTTNYDRYIEAGADAAGLHLIDRFVGTLAPVFRSSRLDLDIHYNPPGIRGEPRYVEGVARFTKLHGSVDWVDYEKTIRRIGLPFGAQDVKPYLKAPGLEDASASQVMIFPNASKDRETAAHPYVELFRDLAAAVCRPNSTLICYGYSFGDEHINRVIEDMLTIPSSHLVVIAFDDPLGRIMQTYEKLGRHAQISLMIGDHLGDFRTLVDNYLPKPAIDRTTFRMAELLKARWGANKTSDPPQSGDAIDAGAAE